MKYIKTLAFTLVILLSIQCGVIKPVSKKKIEKELVEYKLLTEYILCKNYHDDFQKYLIYDWDKMREKDSLVLEFMFQKNIKLIYVINENNISNRKNQIIYQFMYTPGIGKRRELVFDFSHSEDAQKDKRNGYKEVILEKEIRYIEY